ncbi:MAG TPA: hypothetical protein V6D28_04700 [Leptolyngbyaceae cyanobacterium]
MLRAIAHLSLEDLKNWLCKLDNIFTANGKTLSIALNIGKYPDREMLPEEERLFWGETSNRVTRIAFPHEDLFTALQIGDRHLIVKLDIFRCFFN